MRTKKGLKGQVALEYLITYGWAIGALLLIIGIITFYTTSVGSGSIREQCIFPQQIICEKFVGIDASPVGENPNDVDEFRVDLRNNFGHDILFLEAQLSYEGISFTYKPVGGQKLFKDGELIELSYRGRLRLDTSRPVSAKLVVKYQPCFNNQCLDGDYFVTGFITFVPVPRG